MTNFLVTQDTKPTDEVLDRIARIPTEELPTKVESGFFQKLSDERFMRMATLLAKKKVMKKAAVLLVA